MLTLAQQNAIANTVTVPEIRSAVAQTLRGLVEAEDKKAHRLTLMSLLSFYRKSENALSVETDGNILKSRLMESGVLFFGAMFNPRSEATKSQRLAAFSDLGLVTEHLAFLNPEQVELLHVYMSETGLVANL